MKKKTEDLVEKPTPDEPTTDTDSKVKDAKPKFTNYWRILSAGRRSDHVMLCIATGAAAASGVALPLMNIVFGTLVGNFNGYVGPDSGTTEDQLKRSTSKNALYFIYLFIGKFVLTYVGMFCFRIAGLRVSAALRLSYLQALFAQPLSKIDEVSLGTVANTITSSTNTIQMSISDRLATMFQSIALVIAAFAIAFRYSWALTLATSSGIVFVVVMLSITTPFALKALHLVEKSDEKHTTVTSEALSSVRTVFALGAEPKMIERHSRWVDESHKNGLKVSKWMALQICPFYFVTYASYALAFWFGLKLYREGHIDSVSNVIIVFFSILIVTTVFGQIAAPLMFINKAIASSGPFFDMIDSPPVHMKGLKEPEVLNHNDITLHDVSFAYPTRRGVQVLQQFNATIQRGKTTALVGPSGSGKSTVVALLERWYSLGDETRPNSADTEIPETPTAQKDDKSETTPNEKISCGAIRIGDHNIDDFDLRWWRAQIGLVQQEPFLFNDTIERNVSYGLVGTPNENIADNEKLELVKEACIEAFADDFISKLPNGYSTKVGEGGIKLSGGQRQRIAIARSIIRKPSILILDEATSAIDVRGEKIVQEALDRASLNRTTIMIAHRLSTIRKADHIIVLNGGKKMEEGTHDELLASDDGLYSKLVRAQKIEEAESEADVAENDEPLRAIETSLSHASTRKSLDVVEEDSGQAEDEEKGKSAPSAKGGLFKTVGVLLLEQRSMSPLFTGIVLAAMGCGAAYALQSWFFAHLVQTFQYTGQRLIDAANFWALMFFVLAIAVTICYSILAYNSVMVSTNVGAYCRRDYFGSALKMPISYFDQDENSSGSVMQRISGDPKQIQELLGINSSFPLIAIFNVIGSVIISFYYGWKLALVVFFAVMPVIIGASFLRTRYEVQFETNNAKVFSSSSQFATEAVGAFRTVSSLAIEHIIIKKYDGLLADQIKTSTRKASYAMLIYALTDSIELCGMALAFWYGGQLLANREYDPFQFFVIFAAIVQGAQAAGQYLSIIPNLAYATAAGRRILELRGKASNAAQSKQNPDSAATGLGAKVEFKDVTFRYAGHSMPLFNHLNITIQAGQFVAFVGPSGCGKTTTISLLERFYDPVSGAITVDSEDIGTLDTRAYRRNLALVSQEPKLFSGTIRDNVLLGVDASSITEEQITQACRDAEIHDFIISLPDGYGTELGQNTQTALSGGQKQRLCLARALLRQPKLLLLDEATSSLDSQSEKLVQGAIERLASQRSMTVIAVAHRLATIQKADVIFVFGERDVGGRRGSRIIEKGSHNELLGKKGVYWSMCQAQALDRQHN